MRDKGILGILAILFVLVMVGSCAATINFNLQSNPIQSNPIQSVGVEINGFDHNPTGEVSASSYFVGSKYSNVYHYPSCRHAKRIKPENRVYFDTPEEARAAGYRPCKVCKPPPSSIPSTDPPEVTTNNATGIGATYATLNGDLDSTGGLSCQVWFEYGKTMSYGCSTSKVSKSSTGSFSAGISGLAEATTYHFRAVTSNGVGTVYGLDRNFTTPKIHHLPVACFTHLPQSPITIMFDASCSYDQDGSIVEYNLDFGDGVTGTGITYNHTYIANGTYNVKLTVMDNDNLTDTFTYNITIINVTSYDVCDFIEDIGLENLTLAHVLSLIDLFLDPSGFGSLDSIPSEHRPNGIIKNLTEDDINAVTEYYLGNITRGNYYANKSCGRVCVTVSENVKICAFDQNPAGYDEGNEWVELYNPTNHTIDITNWKLKTRYGGGKIVTVPEGSEIAPNDCWFFTCSTGFLRNENESITLMDSLDNEIDRTCGSSDFENNNRFCMRDPDCLDTDSDMDWIFQAQRLERWERRNGTVTYVVDGDTIDISPVERAYIQRIRLVGVDTPERGEQGYEEAKSFVNETCFEKEVYFDVDDCKHYDKYHRILAVIYVNVNGTWINLNAELLKRGYAEIMYIPPSEFNPYEWMVN